MTRSEVGWRPTTLGACGLEQAEAEGEGSDSDLRKGQESWRATRHPFILKTPLTGFSSWMGNRLEPHCTAGMSGPSIWGTQDQAP